MVELDGCAFSRVCRAYGVYADIALIERLRQRADAAGLTAVQVTVVTHKIPSYLRLHLEDPLAVARACAEEVPGLDRLCTAFQNATGWSLKPARSSSSGPAACVASEAVAESSKRGLRAVVVERPAVRADGKRPEGANPAPALELAAAIDLLLGHLQRTQVALWHREAELAAGVPVTVHPGDECHLAERLEAVLRSGSRAVDCQAAAAYLLDENTRQLKLRVCWGLPMSRFLAPPRPLRGAAADLEALVGHAVVVDDTLLVPSWRVPEEFRSAICVPISSPTTPLGTLWMFCDRPRTFGVEETSVLEIISGRLAADLEREMLVQQTLQSRNLKRQLGYASQWQANRLPRIKPMLHGWELSGWTGQGEQLGGDFHDWFVLPDGSLAVAVADAQGKMIEASLTAASVHSALKSHANYRHTAQELIERVNETLWAASAGDQFASLFYCLIQPDSGRMEYASAGHIGAAVVGEQVRHLAADEEFPLGTQPDPDYPPRAEQMDAGEVLVVLSEGVKRLLRSGKRGLLWRLVQRHRRLPADELSVKIQAFLEQQGREDRCEDQTVLVVKRRNE